MKASKVKSHVAVGSLLSLIVETAIASDIMLCM